MIKFIIKAVLRDFSQYFLATIGLIIGITSLIAMGYLGIVGKLQLFQQIKKQGINIVYIYPEYVEKTAFRKDLSGKYPSIKDKEVEFISSTPFEVDSTIAVKFFSGNVKYGRNSINSVEVIGTKGNYIKFFNYEILKKIDNIPDGCFIGYTIFKELFDKNKNIPGKILNISGNFIKIKGILKEKGASSSGRDLDKIIILPDSVFLAKFSNKDFYDAVYVKPVKTNLIGNLKKNIIFLLKNLNENNIFPLKDFQFSVRSMDYYLRKQEKIGKIMVLSTFIVSAITLLVGGLGVMAIMIILSIKETREIGIKRAIGATKTIIFFEYLLKSFFIGIIGSIFGLILGFIAYLTINTIYNISAAFPVGYAVVGILSSFGISVLFGTYPAIKASKIEPSTALHYQ